jgi:hypothetical protein
LIGQFEFDIPGGTDLNSANGINADKRITVFRHMMVSAFQQNSIPESIP